jgi:DNA-binding transcriptional regulator YiaG
VENKIKLKVKTMDFQDQVKFVRMRLQLSQEELARQMGISFATVSRWERESRKPQLALLGKFYSFCQRKGIEIDLSDNSNT